jgi:hypothetical protein
MCLCGDLGKARGVEFPHLGEVPAFVGVGRGGV